MDEKKKGLAILLGLPKKDKGEETDASEESSSYEDEGLEAAAEEVMQAFKDEDTSALKEALKSFVEICRDKEEE